MLTDPRSLYDEFQNYVQASESSGARQRLLKNHDYYVGTNYRQWSGDLVEYYRAQGRTITTFNLIQGIVDSTIGHMEQEPIGPVFRPIEGGDAGAQGGGRSPFSKGWEADAALGAWDQKLLDFRRDALIHTGVLQMVVDRSKDRLGRIDFKLINPKNQIGDPYWVTRDIRDCRGWFVWAWMTAEQIKAHYDLKSEDVQNAIDSIVNETDTPNVVTRDASPDYWDEDASQYKVLEFIWQEEQSRRVVIDTRTGQRAVNFPEKDLEGMTDEVAEVYVEGINPDLMIVREPVSITMTRTICPGIAFDLVLEEGEYPIQLGRLPIFTLSYRETYDDRQGIVDTLIDLQDIYNKRQNMVSHALGGSAGASNIVFEESAFGGDEDLEAEFQENLTQNGKILKVKDGTISEGRYRELQRPPMPLDVLRSVDEIQTMMFRLSGITPAMEGYSDRADESGRLYQQKVRQSLVSLEYFAQTYWHKLEEIAESYAMAFQQVYAGVSRRIVNPRTGEVMELNRIILGPSGPFKVDEVANLPAHFVQIEQKRTGKSRQEEEAQKASQLLPVIKNPLLAAVLEGRTVAGMAADEDERRQVDVAVGLWSQLQAKQLQGAMQPPAPPAPGPAVPAMVPPA